MRITNRLGLPDPIVQAVANDGYSGPRSTRENVISVSSLEKPPRQRRLEKLHADELEEDASARIYSLLGQSIHTILERANVDGIAEARLTMEVEGWTVSGQFDHFTLNGGILSDYKLTSVWSIKDGGRREWAGQTNTYAHLLRKAGYTVNVVRVVAIGRDWRKNEALRYASSGYPADQVSIVELPLWTPEQCDAYLRERVRAHQAAREALPICTPEDRWQRPPTWAVVKDGNKRATKLCASENEAKAVIGEAPKMHIEFRPGLAVRCSQYCSVLAQCQARADGQWLPGELGETDDAAA